jgi:hypothetical protein
MDLSEQIDLILLDFSKAFDKVPHERLLYKAQYYAYGPETMLGISEYSMFLQMFVYATAYNVF